jgi:hypothetical protein
MDKELELQKLAAKHRRWAGIYYRAAAIAAVPPYAMIPFLVPAGYGHELGLWIIYGSLACVAFLVLGLLCEKLAKNPKLLEPDEAAEDGKHGEALIYAEEENWKDTLAWVPNISDSDTNFYGLPFGSSPR